ncbi:MAG: ThuA domain-containing protein [Planctomycetes bacterium]|nr:ThuA domain-containing protein [Planctomycetota bacterium]
MNRRRTIAFIAGPKSHGPEGNGHHDYPWDARVAAAMLARSDVGVQVDPLVFADGWPDDDAVLDRVDAIVLFCDGRDGDSFAEALHLETAERIERVERLMRRGCGLAVIHFGTFAAERDAERVLRWSGGYFQWQADDGARAWRSAITTLETTVSPAAIGHPVLRGIAEFRVREEFYHDLRFPEADHRWTPLLCAASLPATRAHGDVVAWAREREDGGRGFGTTLGHFHANWRLPAYRAFLLNGIAWTAGLEIPTCGVQAPHLDRDAAAAALRGAAATGESPTRVLLLAGNDAHRWHNWERSTPAICAALERDPRMQVEVVHDPEEFARRDLASYGAIALNFCNWQDPRGLSENARAALTGFVGRGGGLLVLHFSNGAFHHSLPEAGASDWPEYRRLVRRVWDHAPADDGTSTHDDYGRFIARPRGDHAIVDGLAAFVLEDELYVKQRGDEPIQPLLIARSVVTGRDEPLAWVYRYGSGRVFQTLLGHSERTYEAFGAREMLRRAAAWVSHREVRRIDPADDCSPAVIAAMAH